MWSWHSSAAEQRAPTTDFLAQAAGRRTEERPDVDLAFGTSTRHSGGALWLRNNFVVLILKIRHERAELSPDNKCTDEHRARSTARCGEIAVTMWW